MPCSIEPKRDGRQHRLQILLRVCHAGSCLVSPTPPLPYGTTLRSGHSPPALHWALNRSDSGPLTSITTPSIRPGIPTFIYSVFITKPWQSHPTPGRP